MTDSVDKSYRSPHPAPLEVLLEQGDTDPARWASSYLLTPNRARYETTVAWFRAALETRPAAGDPGMGRILPTLGLTSCKWCRAGLHHACSGSDAHVMGPCQCESDGHPQPENVELLDQADAGELEDSDPDRFPNRFVSDPAGELPPFTHDD